MRLIVTSPYHYLVTADGRVWSKTMFARSFWERYLAVFDGVNIVARARLSPDHEPPPGWLRVDGENIGLTRLPFFLGPMQFVLGLPRMWLIARKIVHRGDAIIGRVPSSEANLVLAHVPTRDYPFGLEVVADPYDVFAPGAVEHPARPLFRWLGTRRLQRHCVRAAMTAYVTAHALQRRYPPSVGTYSIALSDVELADEAFAPSPRSPRSDGGRFTILTVGSLAQMYKGVDLLLEAAAQLIRQGLPIALRIVGEGRCRPRLERLTATLGLTPHVTFVGEIPSGSPVRDELERCDLFVLPSRTEGLPRALIEAMARAVPCVATRVGGIPELLDADQLVPIDDVSALANKIRDTLSSPDRLAMLSKRNLDKARAYGDKVLTPRREAFYEELRLRTKAWVQRHP